MDAQTKTDVIRRLRCAEGHLRGVIGMVEEDRPCLAVVQQTQAIQGALRQIRTLLVAHHLDDCLRQVWRDQQEDGFSKLREELVALLVQKE